MCSFLLQKESLNLFPYYLKNISVLEFHLQPWSETMSYCTCNNKTPTCNINYETLTVLAEKHNCFFFFNGVRFPKVGMLTSNEFIVKLCRYKDLVFGALNNKSNESTEQQGFISFYLNRRPCLQRWGGKTCKDLNKCTETKTLFLDYSIYKSFA